MARWARYVLDAYPTFNIVGEAWKFSAPHEAYWQDGFAAHPDGYDSNLPSVTDFPLAYAIREAPANGAFKVYVMLSQDFVYPDPTGLVTFFDNHDLDRAYGGDPNGEPVADLDALRLGLALQLTTRGIPQIYYGTEVALPNGVRTVGDGHKRTDMPGGWPGDPRSVFDAADRTEVEQAAFDFTRSLARWRQSADIVHHGRLTQFIPRDGVYVYFRWDETDPLAEGGTVMVVLNTSGEDRQLDLARFQERILAHTTGTDVVTGAAYSLRQPLAIGAREALVLELSE